MIVSFPGGQVLGSADRAGDEKLSQCRRLARVLNITRDMLALADAGDWDAVAGLEQERREDLTACFSGTQDPGQAELVAEALAAILHLNEELMARLTSARDVALEQGVAQARTRVALGHYESVKSHS